MMMNMDDLMILVYLSFNAGFAECANWHMFQGEAVIQTEELEDACPLIEFRIVDGEIMPVLRKLWNGRLIELARANFRRREHALS